MADKENLLSLSVRTISKLNLGITVKQRFEGPENRQRLVTVLRRQTLVGNDSELAEAIADGGELLEFDSGMNLIIQHASDTDIYFLLSGAVAIVINGAQIATRTAGEHVGEMAAIEPSLPRSATVTALEKMVVLKLSSAAFLKIGAAFPDLWLPITQELSRRLHQRNKTIYPPNEAPKLFIISSSEARLVAHSLRAGLEKDVFSTVWDDGVFFAGGYPLEALEKQVSESDFAVADLPPLKWSSLKYDFRMEDKINGKEEAYG